MNIYYIYINNCVTLLNFKTFTYERMNYGNMRRMNQMHQKHPTLFFIFYLKFISKQICFRKYLKKIIKSKMLDICNIFLGVIEKT